jgi:hypothetical protein
VCVWESVPGQRETSLSLSRRPVPKNTDAGREEEEGWRSPDRFPWPLRGVAQCGDLDAAAIADGASVAQPETWLDEGHAMACQTQGLRVPHRLSSSR